MDEKDLGKIETIIRDREYSNNYLKKSKVYNSFLELEKKAFATDRLDRKNKELIALGISITKDCESCIEWHIHQALEFGASFDQIFEAMDVAVEMGGGPATVSVRFAIKVIEYYKNKMIRNLNGDYDINDCVRVIRASFKTVAEEFNITPLNAPAHPSNITFEKLKESMEKGLSMSGLYYRNNIIGFIGIEKSGDEGIYYLEKLAVLPDYRHKGFGKVLIDHAAGIIKKLGGRKISIGIIDGHKVLKTWYGNYGFIEKSVKTYEHLPFKVCFMEKELT